MTESGYRVEHDSMGEVRVPADAQWGAQTQRAVENFPISGRPIAPALVHALALIKAEAARVNQLDRPVKDAIAAAADEVASGAHDDQFPIDTFQTGSGTSSNMNANEVIGRLAAARLAATVRRHAGAPERSRQHVAVVERRVPVGRAPRGRARDHRTARARVARSSRRRCAASSASSRTR